MCCPFERGCTTKGVSMLEWAYHGVSDAVTVPKAAYRQQSRLALTDGMPHDNDDNHVVAVVKLSLKKHPTKHPQVAFGLFEI